MLYLEWPHVSGKFKNITENFSGIRSNSEKFYKNTIWFFKNTNVIFMETPQKLFNNNNIISIEFMSFKIQNVWSP